MPEPDRDDVDRVGARIVVIGQVAGIMHGSRELTVDLHLLWDGDTAQVGLLAAAFTQESARPSTPNAGTVQERREEFWGDWES